MNKTGKFILIFCGILLALPFVLMWAGVFQVYRIGTSANEPALQIGQGVLFSKLAEPERLDHICFKSKIFDLPGEYVVLYRLCGLPNDKLQMRNGKLYVNEEMVDHQLRLKHAFIMSTIDYTAIKDSLTVTVESLLRENSDSVTVNLLDEEVSKFKLRVSPARNLPEAFADSLFPGIKTTGWTVDNFGPLKVPQDAYFVLGDNRHAAADSRYTGFIKKSTLVGTVFADF